MQSEFCIINYLFTKAAMTLKHNRCSVYQDIFYYHLQLQEIKDLLFGKKMPDPYS